MNAALEPAFGIYVHVPFCVRKCAYCDFYSCTDLDKIPSFLESLSWEIQTRAGVSGRSDSLYFGGGTPSLLDPEQIAAIIDSVAGCFNLAADAEITIEANPGTVSADKLSGWRKAGVNRINIGVQSFSDAALKFLTRIHSAADAVCSVAAARSSGFENVGLDLIYGLPGQTAKAWRRNLDAALRLFPAHLSCYMLTYEPQTLLTRNLENGDFRRISDRTAANLYDLTVNYLEDNGFYQYEVSNFSTTIHTRSRHNQKYWAHAPYVGLGPSAHSFIADRRSWNVRPLEDYLGKIRRELPAEEGAEILTSRQRMMETLYLRLRCVDGIAIPEFEEQFSAEFQKLFNKVIVRYASRGLLETTDSRCRLTRKGMRYADGIAAAFIDAA